MTPSLIRPRWWVVPIALCALVIVGCSTVGGSASGPVGSTDPAPSAVSDTPSVPEDGSSSPASVDPSSTPITEPSPSAPASTSTSTSASSESGPGGGTPGASVTSATAVTEPPSSTVATTAVGRMLALARFQSPTRNIGCIIDHGEYVRCDLASSAITEQHVCKDGGDWGQSIALQRGEKAAMQCASDTVLDSGVPVLAYGASTRVGSIVCASRKDGMRCVDDQGHGFQISRTSYVVN